MDPEQSVLHSRRLEVRKPAKSEQAGYNHAQHYGVVMNCSDPCFGPKLRGNFDICPAVIFRIQLINPKPDHLKHHHPIRFAATAFDAQSIGKDVHNSVGVCVRRVDHSVNGQVMDSFPLSIVAGMVVAVEPGHYGF